MKWVKKKLDEVIQALHTNPEQGLTSQQVMERQSTKGLNQYEEEKKESLLHKIGHQLSEVTTIILLIASAISLYLAFTAEHGFAEPAVIIAIVILNTVLGIRQENNAERALEALKNMNTQMTTVIRDHNKQLIDARELVPGDIILLETGDMIPADARIITSSGLKAEESALTGESVPVEKDEHAQVDGDTPLGDRLNMLYSGCLITSGRATAVVVKTGMDTEMGKIAGLLNNTSKQQTPMQIRLAGLGRQLSLIAVAAGMLVFLIGLYQGESALNMLMTAVSLAVAAVPETLPVIVTITLAFGVQNMVGRHALIRRIPAVETLGSASVICSDKTGTLTENRMTVQQVWSAGHAPKSAEEDWAQPEEELLFMLSLVNNASMEQVGDEEKVVGDPTESAIIQLLHDKGSSKAALDIKYPRIFEIPFDSDRKQMTTVHQLEQGYLSVTKGAFDRIPVRYEEGMQEHAQIIHDCFASKALRVLAAGYKYYEKMPVSMDIAELERDLTFAGLVGMIDPLRPESRMAVHEAKQAGIRTVMITGDHIVTASAIARELGILSSGQKAITGAELAELSEEELIHQVHRYSVYARVSPEDKIRIVKAWQARGEVVAMTGDGVNDAPALKAADVGAAMGITGTDVSRNAADMVLTDDNFATIVEAVSEGRRVYDNIRKAIYFLLSCNISEIMIMLIALLLGWGAPVIAIQLLLINVVADGIPGFCLSREAAERDHMSRPPIARNANIFAEGLAARIMSQALIFTIITLVGFYVGSFVELGTPVNASPMLGQTMAFVILGLSSVIHVFNVRSNHESIFKMGFTSNRPLFWCALLSMTIIVLVAVMPPLAAIFQLVPMSLPHWGLAVVLSVIPLIAVELRKGLTAHRRDTVSHRSEQY
ncbi:cation-translocating P-type ATPase [Paenibacillus wulumuqiensis]|uniref:cation-translocating P-type ATPase n=1 Tax=Paenibacillus wulumuqiensis TaxID=1567107 RepID=UPI0006196CAA|nr:cation-translocating P-type ATPase [Paenibacillus wulumuqiensis]